jgi:hypothetical protein
MAASPSEASNIDESAIARQWHSSCPTLKTIILPKGKVWFQETADKTDPKWECLPLADPQPTTSDLFVVDVE